ncbi:MAG: tRNA adenosine(34) deaminase TadA [Anaerolineaceae bacterium]|nr:tRNA adenosine(34) deaminase TadA [Anaerolineaceae bacterium]MCY4105516.1 tRNA adenosine(34) deaminase TadA [Chloroflexota bacterium]
MNHQRRTLNSSSLKRPFPESPSDTDFMRLALAEAKACASSHDVPVGAVVVQEGAVIARGRNRREADQDPCAHAELLALRQAAAELGTWRLNGLTLYSTLEPCAMCAGALVLARISQLVYAADDRKAGAAGSVLNLLQHPSLNHQVNIRKGVLAEEAAGLLHDFFQSLRAAGEK